MTEAMPFLQKTILLSYDPRPLAGGSVFLAALSPEQPRCHTGGNRQRTQPYGGAERVTGPGRICGRVCRRIGTACAGQIRQTVRHRAASAASFIFME